jgi:hypothetical protein
VALSEVLLSLCVSNPSQSPDPNPGSPPVPFDLESVLQEIVPLIVSKVPLSLSLSLSVSASRPEDKSNHGEASQG